MKDYTLSLQHVANFLIIICLSFFIIIVGKSILIPIAFAVLFAFTLRPVCAWYERFLPGRMLSTVLALFTLILPIAGLITFFSWQSVDVFRDFGSIGGKLMEGFDKLFIWGNKQFSFTDQSSEEWLGEHIQPILSGPIGALGRSIASTTAILANVALTLIYTFFLLLYRSAFKNFLLIQFRENHRDQAQRMIIQVQKVTQGYLYGLLVVISILGFTSSIGMWIIGVPVPFFWGFLAAFLAIIPYIGTFLGGFLPFVYMFAVSDNIWQPIAVAGLFMSIQFIDNNFITPNVVGSSVKVNPFAAIVALIVGGSVWGVAGLILSIPVVAILKEIFDQISFLKPVGLLLSSEIYTRDKVLVRRFDKDHYRLMAFFKKDKISENVGSNGEQI